MKGGSVTEAKQGEGQEVGRSYFMQLLYLHLRRTWLAAPIVQSWIMRKEWIVSTSLSQKLH